MKKTGLYILLIIVFLGLEILLVRYVDLSISTYLRMIDNEHAWFINLFRFYTDLGKGQWYLWPSGLITMGCALAVRLAEIPKTVREKLLCLGRKCSFLFITVAASGILTDVIKPMIGRARPVLFEHSSLYGFHPYSFSSAWNSMPSGHATTSFTLIFIASTLTPRLRYPIWIYGIALASSRVMVNAHYLSDIVAAAAVAYITVSALDHLMYKKSDNHFYSIIFPAKGIIP